jgi:hypothetical protein
MLLFTSLRIRVISQEDPNAIIYRLQDLNSKYQILYHILIGNLKGMRCSPMGGGCDFFCLGPQDSHNREETC